MKRMYLLLAAVLLSVAGAQAQHEALHGFVDKYKQDPAFTFAYLSRDLFEVAAKTSVEDRNWKKLHQVIQNLGSLTILAADSVSNGRALYREALDVIPRDELDDLLIVRDGTDDVRIWVKEENAVISDLILLVGSPEEFVLISFTGNLELGDVAKLGEWFDAAEVRDLARASQAVAADFQVSPNPSPGEFVVTYNAAPDAPRRLSLTDQNGRVVYTRNLSGAAAEQITVRDVPPGLYWLQLETVQGKFGVKQVQIVGP